MTTMFVVVSMTMYMVVVVVMMVVVRTRVEVRLVRMVMMMMNDVRVVRRVVWIWIWIWEVLMQRSEHLRSFRHTFPLSFAFLVAFSLEPRGVSDNLPCRLLGEVLLEQGLVTRNQSIK